MFRYLLGLVQLTSNNSVCKNHSLGLYKQVHIYSYLLANADHARGILNLLSLDPNLHTRCPLLDQYGKAHYLPRGNDNKVLTAFSIPTGTRLNSNLRAYL